MISLLLPYWDRQQAADKALAVLGETYAGLDLEVIVVDDGNRVPFVVPDVGLNIRVIRLPLKDEPKSPATCWNEAAKAARGDVLVLSCIEILHHHPVLAQLADEVSKDRNAYALAAAYCPELGEWHCHSTHRSAGAPEMPAGFGRAFCGALSPELYWRAGGWDEDYREGAGWEDLDWAKRLESVGARPVIRDDLVVMHPKTGASIAWGEEKFLRNEALYRQKWGSKPLTFVCVKAGDAFGPEYVNILHDMVIRNLPAGHYRFVCLTDNPEGLDPAVGVMPLPEDLEKWWGKLYLFKRGLFEDGTRMIFMDLDTVIVGKLDRLIEYRGQFATLQDFYQPHRLGPAVMLWEAGSYTSSIWEDWVQEGKPRHDMGDLWWINQLDQGRFAKDADKLQKIYPGMFVSFKAHCNPFPPKGAKVVCFHGLPRPHQATEDWVKAVWKVGGATAAELEIVANTGREIVEGNIRRACATDLPRLEIQPEHGGQAVIVGGGPSVTENLDEIRDHQTMGAIVVALNGSAHYLKRHGILADWQVILDSRPENAAFVLPDVPQHWICSQCDKAVFDSLKRPTIFHVNTEAAGIITEQAHLISTGSTVGLIAMGIAYTQGFRVMHLFGMDSSYTDDRHHAYDQKLNNNERIVDAQVGGRTFRCAPWMVAQVNEFQEVASQLANAGCVITVAGDGLLPHVARLMSTERTV